MKTSRMTEDSGQTRHGSIFSRSAKALSGLLWSKGDGPPDLDELWRDFNKKLSGMFSGKPGVPRPQGSGDGGGSPPDLKGAGIGAGLIAGVIALLWLGSGFFIVQEGQQAVVTSFGKFSHTADAGIQWRMPYPVQASETVAVTQLRSVEVGRNSLGGVALSRKGTNVVQLRKSLKKDL